MGSATRLSMCDRFISEFAKDYLEKRGLANVVDEHLGIDENDECVRHMFTLKNKAEESETYCLLQPVYHPESDEQYVVEFLSECLRIPKGDVLNRLVKADLAGD
jgi:hypothetical protein